MAPNGKKTKTLKKASQSKITITPLRETTEPTTSRMASKRGLEENPRKRLLKKKKQNFEEIGQNASLQQVAQSSSQVNQDSENEDIEATNELSYAGLPSSNIMDTTLELDSLTRKFEAEKAILLSNKEAEIQLLKSQLVERTKPDLSTTDYLSRVVEKLQMQIDKQARALEEYERNQRKEADNYNLLFNSKLTPAFHKMPGIIDYQKSPVLDDQCNLVLERVLRSLPKFSGEKSEDYDGWVLNCKLLLSNYSMPEAQKKLALLMKIEGTAREIVEGSGELQTTDQVFAALNSVYGKGNTQGVLTNKQLPHEPAHAFLGRLKANLRSMGINMDSVSDQVALDYFMNGLLPSLGDRVKNLYPHSLSIAVTMASRIETDINIIRDQRKNKKQVELLNNMQTDKKNSPQLRDVEAHERINALTTRLHALSEQKTYPPRNFDNQRIKSNRTVTFANRPYRGTCFGCQETGHRYLDCPTSTTTTKDEIRRNFSAYLNEYRQKQDNSSNSDRLNSKGVPTNPQ